MSSFYNSNISLCKKFIISSFQNWHRDVNVLSLCVSMFWKVTYKGRCQIKRYCYLISSFKDAYGAINLYNLVLSLNVKKTPWLLSLFILAPTKFISILEQYNHIKPFEIIQIQIFTSQKLNSLFNILQFKKYMIIGNAVFYAIIPLRFPNL